MIRRKPTQCGGRVFQTIGEIMIGGSLSGLSKRVDDQGISNSITLNGIVKVSRQLENELLSETYLTATVDLSARTEDGRKIFESFHIIAIPDGGFETYLALRKRLKESMRSQLRRFVGTLGGNESLS